MRLRHLRSLLKFLRRLEKGLDQLALEVQKQEQQIALKKKELELAQKHAQAMAQQAQLGKDLLIAERNANAAAAKAENDRLSHQQQALQTQQKQVMEAGIAQQAEVRKGCQSY